MPTKPHKLGIAGSGGSTKGMYKIGVDCYLQEQGIFQQATYHGGTSVSAILAAAYRQFDAPQMQEMWMDLAGSASDIFQFALHKGRGLYSLNPLYARLKEVLRAQNNRGIEAMVCAVDYRTTDHPTVYASSKDLPFEQFFDWMICSATIPVMMARPDDVKLDARDGGVKEYIPIRETARNCEKVIAVAMSPMRDAPEHVERSKWVPEIFHDLWLTVDGAMQQEIKRNDFLMQCEDHDVIVVSPSEKLPLGTFEVNKHKFEEIWELGYEDARKIDWAPIKEHIGVK